MCLEIESMLDRIEHGPRLAPEIAWRPFIEGTCLVLIETAGFTLTSLLIVLGLPLFVFLFLVGWDLTLLFAQLGNLAEHYDSAEPLARRLFSRDLQVAFIALAGGFALLRLPMFLRHLARRLDEGGPDHD
ncbi:hypothetical protein [Alteraurantiacibacter buctensis]|uniref:Uncharacterized protein n=1 Tax=Alteraurantiacibacter buctensis TaxID=1503981 RepID=A0A844YTX8_9SPHN|nr:hypothetical protein [Alteraurantiacibacter buctensis]MXO71775.1 hypothetical protein [Alteraurantiacibacter buctensis]